MEEGSWFGPFCFFVGLAVVGAVILLGKDWIEMRGRERGLSIGPAVLTALLSIVGLAIFLWFCLAVVLVVTQ